MPTGEDPLAAVRCPSGCDPVWLHYLSWTSDDDLDEGRISGDRMAQWSGTWALGLRCGNCGTRFGREGVPDGAKSLLDRILEEHQYTLRSFVAELDSTEVEQRERAMRDLIEGNGT